jgi:hypothetical protein
MPVSMTYALTPAPVAKYVNVVLSGRERWSMRSRPQGAFVWVVETDTVRSASTYATRGSARTAATSARVRRAT